MLDAPSWLEALLRSMAGLEAGTLNLVAGLFIAFIGLVDAGFVRRVPDAAGTTVPVGLGVNNRLVGWPTVVFCFGLLLTIVLMPFTFSITNGIGAGVISYAVIKAVQGRWREPGWLLWVVALAFVVYFAIDPVERLLGVK